MTATKQQDDGEISSSTNQRRRPVARVFELWPRSRRFGVAAVAALAVLAALILRLAFLRALGDASTYATFYPAVVIATIFGGFSGGALATLLSFAAVHLWINPYDQPEDWLALLAFLAASAIIIAMLQLLRFAQAARLDRELRRLQEEQLRAIIDTAMEGIVTVDRDGIIQFANPAMCEIYGYEPGEMIGRDVGMLAPESDRSRRGQYIADYPHGGGKKVIGQRRKLLGLRKNGETFPIELTVTAAPFQGDVLFVGQMRDLSAIEKEKRKTEAARAELMHVARLSDMGEVAAGLAHEVSQPLTAVLGYATACRRNLAPDAAPEVAQALEVIESQAKNAADILKRLRGFIEKRESQRCPEKLAQLIHDAVALARVRAGGRKIHIELKLSPDDIDVDVDRVQILQVLINFLRNASDAMAEQADPQVAIVTATASPGFVRVSVCDNGPGVDPRVAEKLFTPFVSTKTYGMGVGLSLCKTIVQGHGGEIGCAANTPRGAVFFFTLPVLARAGA